MLRGLLSRTQTASRWAPGLRQLANALTKDNADCADTLRSALRLVSFCLGDEQAALRERAAEKERWVFAIGVPAPHHRVLPPDI